VINEVEGATDAILVGDSISWAYECNWFLPPPTCLDMGGS